MNSLLQLIGKTILKPSHGIGEAMGGKKWLAPLIIILFTHIIFTLLIYPISKTQLSSHLSEEQLNLIDRLQDLFIVLQLVLISLLLIIATFFIYLFYKIADTKGYFVNFFSAFCFASIIDLVIGGAIRTLIILIKRDANVMTNLSVLLPQLNSKSFFHIFVSQFDIFKIWSLIALALGIAYNAKISYKKSLIIILAFFLFKILLITPISYIFIRLFS